MYLQEQWNVSIAFIINKIRKLFVVHDADIGTNIRFFLFLYPCLVFTTSTRFPFNNTNTYHIILFSYNPLLLKVKSYWKNNSYFLFKIKHRNICLCKINSKPPIISIRAKNLTKNLSRKKA